VPALADPEQALAWARAERTALLACLDHATRTGQHARVIALTAGLAELLRRDGPWADAITRHTTAIAAARHLGDRLSQANALYDLSTTQRMTSDYQAANETLGRTLDIYRAIGDQLGLANTLNNLGDVLRSTGDYLAAGRANQEALGIYRDIGDHLGEARRPQQPRGRLGHDGRLPRRHPGA